MVVFVVCIDRWMVCGRRRVMVNGWVDGWMGGCILQQIIVKKNQPTTNHMRGKTMLYECGAFL